ncbi:MAG: M48 family metalloprotease [Lachnospiraceae bacterium]|nr:M48 family metalloprotease [Lachnospiraceae bacterium]
MDKLPSDLIASVLAHECGHIACKHYLYHSMAGLLAEGICSSPLSKIPAVRRYLTPTIVRALLFWDRCSELSADRAAVLCDGGADKTVAVLLKLHGYKHVEREEFLKQAMDLRAFVNDSRSNRLMELMLTQDETHPRLATRAYECYEWSTSDRFKRILEGTYTPSSRHEFPIAADKATNQFGGGLQHHLRDFSHHPTPVGLLCSILTQFTGKVYGTDVDGAFQAVELNADGAALMGKNLHEKMLFGVVNWVFHMASDMAGASGSVMKGSLGTGLPGPVVSLLRELSSTPLFRKMDDKGHREFSVWISKLFNGTLLGERDADGFQHDLYDRGHSGCGGPRRHRVCRKLGAVFRAISCQIQLCGSGKSGTCCRKRDQKRKKGDPADPRKDDPFGSKDRQILIPASGIQKEAGGKGVKLSRRGPGSVYSRNG